ncbi:ZIP family metal transporter [Vulgatibacter sp.]|uniref:ZIP family metal transporter n=1 Tax=Vulgatibacter sp. TaxID=1971226 RepID=UPI003562338F
MPLLGQAVAWGLIAGSGLLLGAVAAVSLSGRLPHRVIAGTMSFGGGVLIAQLSVDLMEAAFRRGGPAAATAGFLAGAVVFCSANWRLSRAGARHRNRCGGCVQQPTESQHPGSGRAIALGAVLDGIPESLVIGLSLLGGERTGIGLVAGFFLANIPQGLSSASGMLKARRSTRYIFGVWTGIPVSGGLASGAGLLLLGGAPPAVLATILAFAAGGVLAMLAESMIPEAAEDAQPFTGLFAVLGFLCAFLILKAVD